MECNRGSVSAETWVEVAVLDLRRSCDFNTLTARLRLKQLGCACSGPESAKLRLGKQKVGALAFHTAVAGNLLVGTICKILDILLLYFNPFYESYYVYCYHAQKRNRTYIHKDLNDGFHN